MSKKKKGKSIFHQICIFVILMSVILAVLLNYIWYSNTRKLVYTNEIQSSSALLEQLAIRLEDNINQINISSYSFLFDTRVRDIVSVSPKDEEAKVENEAYIRQIFTQMKESNTMIRSVEFIGNYYQISSEDTGKGSVDFAELKEYDWYQNFSNYYLETFTPLYNNTYIRRQDTEVIGWTRKISGSLDNTSTAGILLIEISYSGIASLMEQVQETTGGQLIIIDKRENLIFHPENRQTLNEEEEEVFERLSDSGDSIVLESRSGSYVCISQNIATPEWRVVMLVEQDNLRDSLVQSTMQTIIIVVIIVAGCIVLSAVFPDI